MSAESENGKTAAIEKDEKDAKQADGVENDSKTTGKTEKMDDIKMKTDDGDAKEDSKSEEKNESNKDGKVAEKVAIDADEKDVKDDKKDKKKDSSGKEKDSEKDEDVTEEEDDEEENEDDDEEDKKEKKASPKKKGTQKNSKDSKEENDEDEDDEGGLELGEIPRIDASISRFKNDDLKMLHKLLFKSPIKTPLLKKNIRKFNGFTFKKSSDEYEKKLSSMSQFELKQLRVICEMLDLEKKGSRDEISERILEFLVEPKDSVPGKESSRGRPRRSAAVKANNRGYSDEEYSSDERASPRAKRNAGRRTNLKDETSSEESDEDFQPSDETEEEKPKKPAPRAAGRRKKEDKDSEDEESEEDSDSDYSDEGPRGGKQRKIANNKPKAGRGGSGATRGRRGRMSATATAAAAASTGVKRKAPAKRGRKKQESSEEESEAREEASSSEDEPLAKKSAKNPQPPTDDEIKTYVKEILDGANLEEITMKTVCKQVYAHYPDFDLTHKKDYIKNTVKSLIST